MMVIWLEKEIENSSTKISEEYKEDLSKALDDIKQKSFKESMRREEEQKVLEEEILKAKTHVEKVREKHWYDVID